MKSVIPPLYLEIRKGENRLDFGDITRALLKECGHGNPSGVDFTLGDIIRLKEKDFIEFRCLAGSAWATLLLGVKNRNVNRSIAHTREDQNYEIEIIEPK
jgi:hypothetical protein